MSYSRGGVEGVASKSSSSLSLSSKTISRSGTGDDLVNLVGGVAPFLPTALLDALADAGLTGIVSGTSDDDVLDVAGEAALTGAEDPKLSTVALTSSSSTGLRGLRSESGNLLVFVYGEGDVVGFSLRLAVDGSD